MITPEQADQLTKLVRTIRPGWDHGATMRILLTIGGSMNLTQLTAHAIAVASNPEAKTPRYLTLATNPDEPPPTQTPTWQGPPCDICGRTERMCRFVGDKERAHQIPDPHAYTPALKATDDGRRPPAHIGNPDTQPELEP